MQRYIPRKTQNKGSTGKFPGKTQNVGCTGKFPGKTQNVGCTGKFSGKTQNGGCTGKFPGKTWDATVFPGKLKTWDVPVNSQGKLKTSIPGFVKGWDWVHGN